MVLANVINQNTPCKACENSTPVDQAIGITLIAGAALATAFLVKKCFDAAEGNRSYFPPTQTWTAAILSHAALTAFAIGYIIFLELIAAVVGPLAAVAVAIGVAAAYTVTIFKLDYGMR